MIQVVRRLQFCAGHRVVGHEGKCKDPHGHNYIVYIYAHSEVGELDPLGRVIDFGVLKEKIGTWIDANWDHAFLVWEEDKILSDALCGIGARVFSLPRNPTAENIAHYLMFTVCPNLIAWPVVIHQIDVEETPNCTAILHHEKL